MSIKTALTWANATVAQESGTGDHPDTNRLRTNGSAAFFVDGRPIQNPRSYEEFKTLIDDRLSN